MNIKKDAIIRKKLHNGNLVGPYMRVINAVGHMATVDVIGTNETIRVDKTLYEVIPMAKVELETSIYNRCRDNMMSSIIHEATARWLYISDIGARIIQIKDTRSTTRTMMFNIEKVTVVNLQLTSSSRVTKCVRVWLGERIL